MPSSRPASPPKSHTQFPPKLRATSLKYAIISIVTFHCLIGWLLVAGQDQRVQVGVYFESRCPDSRAFFLDQLVPTYRAIGSIMSPLLVPFGKARVYGPNDMVCQHGNRECDGNRLMGCILARGRANDSQVIETIGCIFEGSPAQSCVSNHMASTVSFADIEACKKGDESFKMMVDYEKLTGRLSYVPKLTINGLYSEDIQREAEYDLKATVCKNYPGTKPDVCKS